MTFRNNLVRYYLRSRDYENMKKELNFIYSCDPNDESAEIVELFYYVKINDLQKAGSVCERILKTDPLTK